VTTIFTVIFALLSLIGIGIVLWQFVAGVRYRPLSVSNSFQGAVSVLKPLKGSDPDTLVCLESWVKQEVDFPLEFLFGVADVNDPVCAVVKQLQAKYPKKKIRLVIAAEQLGPNAKVSTLVQLSRLAAHPIIVVSDADTYLDEGKLALLVNPLADPKVGLVHCFYQFANPSTPAMRWEAVAVNADFWTQVLQSAALKKVDFALGAAMALRAEDLRQVGGFEGLVEYLADDYQLGHRLAYLQKEIVFAPFVVRCFERISGWQSVWRHQLRWARTIRICQPVPFFFSILSNPLPWPVVLCCVYPRLTSFAALIGIVIVRQITAYLTYRKMAGRPTFFFPAYVLLKDLLHLPLWAAAFLGQTVEWRGDIFRIERGGKLIPRQKTDGTGRS
jgi:ceramide glucosyltransferase